MLGMKQDSNLRDPHAKDCIVHFQLSSGLGRHQVGAILASTAKEDLKHEHNHLDLQVIFYYSRHQWPRGCL